MSPEEADSRPVRTPTSEPTVLAFHKLFPRLSFGVTNFSPDRFEKLICFLRKTGFRLSGSFQDEAEHSRENVIFSFDDGYQHLCDHLPALIQKHKFTPIVFVPTAYIGRPNCWDYSHVFQSTQHLTRKSIRELSDLGVRFGSHGHSHSDLTRCSSRQLKTELSDSRSILEDITGQRTAAISYPFGRFNQHVLDTAGDEGYKRGFTMMFPTSHDDRLTLGRIAVYSYDTLFTLNQKLAQGPLYPLERLKARITSRLSGGTLLFNRLCRRTSA